MKMGASIETLARREMYGGRKGRSARRRLKRMCVFQCAIPDPRPLEMLKFLLPWAENLVDAFYRTVVESPRRDQPFKFTSVIRGVEVDMSATIDRKKGIVDYPTTRP
jgi:hypothetical protein